MLLLLLLRLLDTCSPLIHQLNDAAMCFRKTETCASRALTAGRGPRWRACPPCCGNPAGCLHAAPAAPAPAAQCQPQMQCALAGHMCCMRQLPLKSASNGTVCERINCMQVVCTTQLEDAAGVELWSSSAAWGRPLCDVLPVLKGTAARLCNCTSHAQSSQKSKAFFHGSCGGAHLLELLLVNDAVVVLRQPAQHTRGRSSDQAVLRCSGSPAKLPHHLPTRGTTASTHMASFSLRNLSHNV